MFLPYVINLCLLIHNFYSETSSGRNYINYIQLSQTRKYDADCIQLIQQEISAPAGSSHRFYSLSFISNTPQSENVFNK